MLSETSRVTTTQESAFRVQYPNSKPRAVKIIALDAQSAGVVDELARAPLGRRDVLHRAQLFSRGRAGRRHRPHLAGLAQRLARPRARSRGRGRVGRLCRRHRLDGVGRALGLRHRRGLQGASQVACRRRRAGRNSGRRGGHGLVEAIAALREDARRRQRARLCRGHAVRVARLNETRPARNETPARPVLHSFQCERRWRVSQSDHATSDVAISLTINGELKTLAVPPWTTMLDLLRLDLGLTGTKRAAITANAAPAPRSSMAGASTPA